MRRQLAEHERWHLINMIRIATHAYAEDVRRFANHDRLSTQFKQQMREAQLLADEFEKADAIIIDFE